MYRYLPISSLDYIFAGKTLPLFTFCFLASLVFGVFSLLLGSLFEIFGKALWTRGVFLDDDRLQRIPVDDSILKAKLKITRKQRKIISLRFKNLNAWKNFHNLLFAGMLLVSFLYCSIASNFYFQVPRYISTTHLILWVVVGVVYVRLMKLFALKIRCKAAIIDCRCGSCLYELQGQIPESDGCVVCPECGGAWRLDRCQKCATKLDSVDTDSCQECGWNRPATREAESEPAR